MRSLVVAVAVALGAGLACGAQEPAGEEEAAAVEGPCAAVADRRPAPALELESLDGREYSLAELRGKTVVLDFWATWCPPCEFQIPVLNAVYDAWRDQGVEVLGIAVDAEGASVVGPYAEKHEVRYPILIGTEALARKFGAMGFPSSVLVAPDGTMSRAHAGLIEQADLEASLACLQEQQAAPSGKAAPEANPAPAEPAA